MCCERVIGCGSALCGRANQQERDSGVADCPMGLAAVCKAWPAHMSALLLERGVSRGRQARRVVGGLGRR